MQQHEGEEDKATAFWNAETSLEALAMLQGVSPVTDFSRLRGDFWPEEEGSEEFVIALREWRQEEGVQGFKG